MAPVVKFVAKRSASSATPADHATSALSGDHANEDASRGTFATARGGLPSKGMIHSLPSASIPIRLPSGERASPINRAALPVARVRESVQLEAHDVAVWSIVPL